MVRRLIIMIPQLIALSIIIFILAEFMPGDALSGEIDPNVSPERLEELRQMFGFYDPWYVKYTRWIGNIIRGDFGRSIAHQMPVTQIIGQRIGNTCSNKCTGKSIWIYRMAAIPYQYSQNRCICIAY